jgi:hypothetical protein
LPIDYLTLAKYYKLIQIVSSSLEPAGISHGKENREKRGGGGMYGKPFLFYPAALGQISVAEAG